MLITVMYNDGKIGMVEAYQLDELIHSKKIKKFMRMEEWVTVGVDPIRTSTKTRDGSHERREKF